MNFDSKFKIANVVGCEKEKSLKKGTWDEVDSIDDAKILTGKCTNQIGKVLSRGSKSF